MILTSTTRIWIRPAQMLGSTCILLLMFCDLSPLYLGMLLANSIIYLQKKPSTQHKIMILPSNYIYVICMDKNEIIYMHAWH